MDQVDGHFEWTKARGRPIPLSELQRLDDLARRDVEQMGGAAGDAIASGAMAGSLTPPGIQGVWARITGGGGADGPLYSWERVVTSGNEHQSVEGEAGGTLNLLEVNGNEGIPTDGTVVVQVFPSEDSGGENWRFSHPAGGTNTTYNYTNTNWSFNTTNVTYSGNTSFNFGGPTYYNYSSTVNYSYLSNTTVTIGGGVDFIITGPPSSRVRINVPWELCSWWFLCWESFLIEDSQLNNWDGPSVLTADEEGPVVLRFEEAPGPLLISGMVPAGDGQVVILVNDTGHDINVLHDSELSDPEFAFLLEDGEHQVLGDGAMAFFWYDADASPLPGWRCLRQPGSGGGVDTDEKVKVTSADTTTNYLSQKVAAGANISLTVLNAGGNEQLAIAATAPADATATSGQSVLGGNYTLTSTMAATGLSVTLPTAGVYALDCDVHALLNVTTAGNGYADVRLYDNTAGAQVTGSYRNKVCFANVANVDEHDYASISVVFTCPTDGTVIQLQASRVLGPTYTTSLIGQADTVLRFVKLS